jgi:tetratricopeptide (TPR) repeat protein
MTRYMSWRRLVVAFLVVAEVALSGCSRSSTYGKTCNIGSPDEVIAACSNAIASGGGHGDYPLPSLYDFRARAYLKKQQYQLAIADYSQGIALQPDIAGRYRDRAAVYLEMGDQEHALEDAEKAVQLNPTSENAAELQAIQRAQNGR